MRWTAGLRAVLIVLVLIGAVGGVVPRPVETAGAAPTQPGEYGFNVFLAGNSQGAAFNQQTLAKVNAAGFGWVRIQLQWREVEATPGNYQWAAYDTMIAAAAGAGAKVLVSVAKSPDWANPQHAGALPTTANVAAFGRMMEAAAARYRGRVQAWEVWNEPNLAGEGGSPVAVGPYYATLSAAYGGIKRGDGGAVVVFAGLAPTTVTDRSLALDDAIYLREFYEYNGGAGRAFFDVLGAHAGSAANTPEQQHPEDPGPGHCPPIYAHLEGTCWNRSPDFYFRRIEDQRAVMERHGDAAKQVWVTEFGWDSCEGLPAPSGYEYCLLISEQEQADYLLRAIALARSAWPWSGVLFVWNLNYAAIPGIAPGDEKYGWSLLRADWSERPAFRALVSPPPASTSPAPSPSALPSPTSSPTASPSPAPTSPAPSPTPAPSTSPAPSPTPLPAPVPGQAFADVPPDYWAYDQIGLLATRAITAGCGDDDQGRRLYCPARGVTRAEMAVFLTRTLGQDQAAPPATPTFADVPPDHWAYGQIETFARLGITTGCGTDGQGQRLYCPERGVTRAEMAAFLVRARGQAELPNPAPTFADVPPGYWAYGWIEQFYTLGVTTGCGTDAAGNRVYCPDRGVTRAEMAVFIVRAYP